VKRFPHAPLKMRGFVESIEPDGSFWARVWFCKNDGSPRERYPEEFTACFDQDVWPHGEQALEEGVFFSVPARRDAWEDLRKRTGTVHLVRLPPYTKRDILKAQQWAHQMVKLFGEVSHDDASG